MTANQWRPNRRFEGPVATNLTWDRLHAVHSLARREHRTVSAMTRLLIDEALTHRGELEGGR